MPRSRLSSLFINWLPKAQQAFRNFVIRVSNDVRGAAIADNFGDGRGEQVVGLVDITGFNLPCRSQSENCLTSSGRSRQHARQNARLDVIEFHEGIGTRFQ